MRAVSEVWESPRVHALRDSGTRRQQDFLSPDQPNVARIYDYFLGGRAHFAADRAAAAQLKVITPDITDLMRANRAFLRRAVTFLIEQGISQYLDIGSGIPMVGNVHEIAQELNSEARVVYVDHDPVAVTYSQQLLQGNHSRVPCWRTHAARRRS